MRFLSLAVAAVLAAASAGAGAQELRLAIAAPATSMDPQFYNAAPNNTVAVHFFDRLTNRTPDAGLEPWLAQSWTAVSDTIWEFKLRPGVKWHDGENFTADDVAFSLARAPSVPNSPGGFGGFLRAIARVEVIDPLTIRLHMKAPSPNQPNDLATVAIISRKHGAGAATEDYNSGKAMIGTGPYRFTRFIAGDRVEMARNDSWWGPKPAWERVNFRFIPNSAARTAALLAGDVDLIDVPPAADLPRLREDKGLAVVSTQGLRVIYLVPDFSRTGEVTFITDNAGNKLDKNPLLDPRVRRALSLAINRQGLAERVMQGTASATGQWLPAGTFGYNPDVKPPVFDAEGAKKLLAEAGFPQGFKITLHTPNDRYPNDAATAQAVAQMWSRIGVQTQVEALPWASYAGRGAKQEWSIGLWGWGSGTAEAGYTLINVIGTFDRALGRGTSNHGRYSNPAIDGLTDTALSTLNDGGREKLLRQGVAMAMDDNAFIPLYQLTNFWAHKKTIIVTPRADDGTRAFEVRPAR